MGISQILGPNYHKMSDRQLLRLMHNITFEHLKEDIILFRKENSTDHDHLHIWTRGNNLKSLASIFQVAISFHPRHLQLKILVNSCSALTERILTK